ncbi:MAG: biotin transporter BioY [Candidatus Hecatellaceae archaeon]
MPKLRLKAYELSLASLFAALTALGAYLFIPLPFTPVPITLQTFFTYLAILLLGGKLAALSQTIYVLMGALGLPVFAGGKAGFGVLLGPTGGYLIGFIIGAYVGGKTAGKTFLQALLGLLAATSIIYGLGVLQLWAAMNTLYGKGLSLVEAAFMGTVPFIFSDLAKMLIALSLVKSGSFKFLQRLIQGVN